MNKLQKYIPTATFGQIFVTMNPPTNLIPSQSKTHARYSYTHPTYTPHLISSQPLFQLPLPTPTHPTLQGARNTWFAGAWTGYGFHEDGFTSGAQVAIALGAQPPFEINEARYKNGERMMSKGFVENWVRSWWYGGVDALVGGALLAIVSYYTIASVIIVFS